MKRHFLFIVAAALVLGIFNMTPAQAATVKLKGKQAKLVYEELTGSAVQAEGAAGHLYRTGKAITCRYVDVDMSDENGQEVPQYDPRRYACGMKIDKDGAVLPANQF